MPIWDMKLNNNYRRGFDCFMKKLNGFIFWSGIFIILTTTIVSNSLSNLDEIWNFNIARCIANGLVPYKDISMVSTPLLGFLVAPFLKIFGTELFVTRILSLILSFIILILVYNILRKLDVPQIISRVAIIFVVLLQLGFIDLNYNYLSLFLVLIIILLEIRCLKKKNKMYAENIFIGIFGGLSICTKQTIGVLVCAIILLSPLFFIRAKNEIKKALINIVFRMIGIMIPLITFIVYLQVNNAFSEFVDYSIKGVKTFTNKISYKRLVKSESLQIRLLSIIIPIILISTIIFNIVVKLRKKENYNLFILTVYALPIFALIYPIADECHFIIASIPVIILFIYELTQLTRKYVKKNMIGKYIIEFIDTITILWTIAIALFFIIQYDEVLGNISKYKLINNFNYINISDSIYKSIITVDDYINSSEKKVYIIDASAAVYMIPLERYNKNYDMFNLGNLGSGSEEGQIENIKNENAKYLILKDEYNRNWQNPENVRSYIKENMKYIESVDRFDVYENINDNNVQSETINNEIEQVSEENTNVQENQETQENVNIDE